MGFFDIMLIILLVLAVVGVAFYFFNRWAGKKTSEQQDMINRAKQPATIYVIDKKRDKITNVNMPKSIMSQVPRFSKKLKMCFVKAKIGPQILTLICDKRVFEAMPVKKSVKVEIAGIYITELKGMKTKYEMAQIAKERKAKRAAEGAETKQGFFKGVVDRVKKRA